jgi:hypothetical protein
MFSNFMAAFLKDNAPKQAPATPMKSSRKVTPSTPSTLKQDLQKIEKAGQEADIVAEIEYGKQTRTVKVPVALYTAIIKNTKKPETALMSSIKIVMQGQQQGQQSKA